MKTWTVQPRVLGLLLATTVISTSSLLFLPGSRVKAQETGQNILQQDGRLEPMQAEYTFQGRRGQSVAVTMSSADFDTVLSLVDPRGEEIGYNDDFGRSLNSTIVMTLPADGTYKVVARSFSGTGGNYSVAVRPATRYEQAYSRALKLYQDGNTAAAIDAYTEAIGIDPNQAVAYLERAEARYSQAYAASYPGEGETMPEEVPQLTREQLRPIIADYQRAAELYEQSGDIDTAQAIREQMTYMQQQPQ